MWSPGYFRFDLEPGAEVAFIATTETWEIQYALMPKAAAEAEIGRRETLLAQARTPRAMDSAPNLRWPRISF